MSYDSDEGPELLAEKLRLFFDNSRLYTWEGEIGRGANGAIYKIRSGPNQRIALKVCPQDVDLAARGDRSDRVYDARAEGDELSELEGLRREAGWLKKLRGCGHVIQTLDVAADPLLRTPPGIRSVGSSLWLYMEFAPNGTLYDFIERNKELYDRPLPNRLLWRLFMCCRSHVTRVAMDEAKKADDGGTVVIRGCLELAFHEDTEKGRPDDLTSTNLNALRTKTPGLLSHLDLHTSNIVVGSFVPNFQAPEHIITPIFKMIDFGEAKEVETSRLGPGSYQNAWDCSKMMLEAILSDTGAFMKNVVATVGSQMFRTEAGELASRRAELVQAGVDADLIDLVSLCLASDMNQRPRLVDLAITVRRKVLTRGPGTVHRETDNAIRDLVLSLIVDADTMDVEEPELQRKRGREEVDDGGDDTKDGRDPKRQNVG
ncbi:hypothetical protein F5Y15DRAFT_423851 [Xylariaceae sp. FL0016]|nr:hypothetical protein F5Y15DRAFT_423851 [Xylariaceae sp. FL0016]